MDEPKEKLDLSAASDVELKDELQRREDARKARRRSDISMNRGFVEEYVESLLLFVPKHDRTPCSDEKPCNSSGTTGRMRCRRCELLRVLRNRKTHDNLDVTVYLDVRVGEEP
jgi:hypothetical protein